MFNFKSIYFVIFTLILYKGEATISDKRLCANENCSELVSVGVTIIKYASPEKYVLSFARNQPVNVYSHGAGIRPELVGVEINGKRGYINKEHFRETSLLKRPRFLRDTELVADKSNEVLEGAPEIKADPAQQPYEIVDGTKIPLDVASSSTEAPVVISTSSKESTQPLNSVPVNQNDKPLMQDEQKAVNPEEYATAKNQQESEQEKVVDTSKNDASSVDDDDDDEDDDDPEEIDAEEDETEDDDDEDDPKIENKEDTIQNASGNDPSPKKPLVGNDAPMNITGNENNPKTGESQIKTENTGTIKQLPEAPTVSEKVKESVPLPEMVVTTPVPPHLPMVNMLRKPDTEGLANQPSEKVNVPYGAGLAYPSPDKVNMEKPDGEGLVYPSPDKVNMEKPDGEGLVYPPPEKVDIQKPDGEGLVIQPSEIVRTGKPDGTGFANLPPETVIIEKPNGEGFPNLPPETVSIEETGGTGFASSPPGTVGEGFANQPPATVSIEKPNGEGVANLPPENASILNSDAVIENVSINTENKLPAQTVDTKEEVKEPNLPQESSLPPSGLEIPSPLVLDVVTPNPIDNKNPVENMDKSREGANTKAEENTGGSLVGGLGGMFSMFSSVENRDIADEASSPDLKETKEPTENGENKGSMISKNVFTQNGLPQTANSLDPVPSQNDLPQSVNFEVPVQNKVEDVTSGNAFPPSDLPKSLNSEEPSQDKVEDRISGNAFALNDQIVNSEVPSQNKVESEEVASNPEVVVSSEALNSDNVDEAITSDSESQAPTEASPGIFENVMSFLSGTGGKETEVESEESVKTFVETEQVITEDPVLAASNLLDQKPQEVNKPQDPSENVYSSWSFANPEEKLQSSKDVCDNESKGCPQQKSDNIDAQIEKETSSNSLGAEDLQFLFVEAISSDLFLYLSTTAVSVILLVFGMVLLDKCRREGPLIARINKLEQQLLTTMKENEMLQEKTSSIVEEKTQLVVEAVPNEVVEELNQKLAEMSQAKQALEEQVQALEKELDTSTEVGIELNKIITEMLNSTDGSDIIKENIEQMQKKLLEQQDSLNAANEALNLKETENHELRLEMEICNKKVIDLQSELDKMVEKILKIEEERDQQHGTLENEILSYQTQYKEALSKEQTLNAELQALKQQVTKLQRLSEVKVKEYNILKESMSELKLAKNNKDALKSLLEVSEVRAELEQFKTENSRYSEQIVQEREANAAYGTKIERLTQELNDLKERYKKADKEKVEIDTKLQVLNNYFKEKEDQMQKEISKYESLWAVKKGEATSTTERIRHMQEELQNYRAQNESLKQEIMNQEVELKSQISMLEKKAHESWVTNRQTERKLEEARQEAAQLRNRLTLRERAIAEGTNQARMQTPLHQNGELPISPPPLDPTQSPPPLFNPRDHMTKSPPMPGMPPPPFLPPPLGATPFIPPPPLDGMMPPMGDMGGMPPPFMPHLPPGMFPGDHRPPPLGRMSSPPPVGGRYSPESTVYSDYDRYSRRSPSPPYDSEYGASPPPIRGYSPYQDRLRDDRREYKRPQLRSNGRNSKAVHSSGSENDSLGKMNKKPQRNV